VALSNRRMIDDLRTLFDSFIKLIATVIDEKSPYTGEHCRRVPDLTMLLAEAVSRQQEGALKDFVLTDEDRYQLEVAAWLHDCGKITTPEHVINKATKLETVFDRIHVLDLRFEVLKRDAEIAALRAMLCAARGEAEPGAEPVSSPRETLRRLDEDRAFLQRCNVGSESMSEEDCERVRQIAAMRWRDAEGCEQPLLTQEEVHSLTVLRGTLTPDERAVVNNHIAATIAMLQGLPFPKHLKDVPEFAGAHHERMDGKGYPRGLTREQIPIPARIIAIADIFEALTANNRPYKKGKSLRESLEILGRMRLDAHIDPDLFDVFVREQVYLRYAERYLDPEQLDAVDHAAIPGFDA
jgi:hypothetical protein